SPPAPRRRWRGRASVIFAGAGQDGRRRARTRRLCPNKVDLLPLRRRGRRDDERARTGHVDSSPSDDRAPGPPRAAPRGPVPPPPPRGPAGPPPGPRPPMPPPPAPRFHGPGGPVPPPGARPGPAGPVPAAPYPPPAPRRRASRPVVWTAAIMSALVSITAAAAAVVLLVAQGGQAPDSPERTPVDLSSRYSPELAEPPTAVEIDVSAHPVYDLAMPEPVDCPIPELDASSDSSWEAFSAELGGCLNDLWRPR